MELSPKQANMRQIAEYLDLKSELAFSDYKLVVYKDSESDFEAESKLNQQMRVQLDEHTKLFSQDDENVDRIRLGFIYVANGFLKSFMTIASHGSYYPDLSQGMIIPGYLLGKLLEDFLTALRTEGDYSPVSYVYMSKDEWDYSTVERFLNRVRDQLSGNTFRTKLQAIEYYDQLREDILEILSDLRNKNLI